MVTFDYGGDRSMMLELTFLIGLIVGLLTALILFYFLFHDDLKAADDFEERQERYRKMI